MGGQSRDEGSLRKAGLHGKYLLIHWLFLIAVQLSLGKARSQPWRPGLDDTEHVSRSLLSLSSIFFLFLLILK